MEESRWEREGEVGRPLKLLGSGNSRHGFEELPYVSIPNLHML
jgi:hypothetical protein